MATVTGMTAEAMRAIRDGTIVDGHFDTAGHLILTKFDGTQIDGGAVLSATTGQAGVVELATNAEVQAGIDTARAVTPAGLAAIPGSKVQVLSGIAETADSTAYPVGVSVMSLSDNSNWLLNSGYGFVVTSKSETDRAQQWFYSNAGGTNIARSWFRTYHSTNGGGGWTAWAQGLFMVNLNPASFSQSTAFTSYPTGRSRLYFASTASTGWDFAGKAGEVLTISDGVSFARQQWTKHSGSTAQTELWIRTATTANGWSPWRIVSRDAKLTDPQLANFNGQNTITATGWADLPNPLSISLSLAYDAIVQVEFGAWLSTTYVDAATTTRAGISIDGTIPENVGNTGTWGAVLYEPTVGSTAGGGQHSTSMTMKMTAGTHVIKAQAYKTGTGVTQVNYPVLRVTPMRWAE